MSGTRVAGTRPDWVDDELFPFESRFLDLVGHTIHYVDEGEGPTLLLYHGNPTWSFLYRDLIAGLRDRFRCIAWDYPGFGLSAARAGYGFTPAEHADVATAFVDALDLTDVTPMVQDWGGPIGMAAAVRHPERYRSFIIGNTWAWPTTDLGAKIFSNVLGGPIGKQLILRRNLFADKIVPYGHGRHELTAAELRHYTAPFPDADARIPTWVFPRAITRSQELLAEVAEGLPRVNDRPALIVWGDGDMAFKEAERRRWENAFPDHTTHVLRGASHYIQDDAPDEIIEAIEGWWR